MWLGGGFGLLLGEQEAAAIRKADAAAKRPAFQQEPPPYTPEAAEQRQDYLDRRGVDDPMAKCLLSGVPRITVRPLPFEIIQLRDRVIILYEVHHAFRIIPTDGRPHPDDHEPSYLGRLRGALGGRHAGGGRGGVQHQHLAGRRRHHSQREAARDRALHAATPSTRSSTT